MMDDDFELDEDAYNVPTEEIHGGHGAAALERANWHLRHIAAIDRRAAIDEQVYRTELERIERWGAQRKARWDRMRAWHTKPCVDLLASIRATDPRTKTLDLPAGKIKSRASTAPRITVTNPDELFVWALANMPDLIRPNPRVSASDVRNLCDVVITADEQKVIAPTGEVVPGVEVTFPGPTYSVDVSSEDFG